METLLGLVGAMMLEVAGPACRLRRSRTTRSLHDQLLSDLSADSRAAKRLAGDAHARLRALDLQQRDLIDLMEFTRSDAGAVMIRLVTVYSISTAAHSDETHGALTRHVESLVRLHLARAPKKINEVASELVLIISDGVTTAFEQLRKRDNGVAMVVRDAALQQYDSQLLISTATLDRRSRELDALRSLLPAQIETTIQDYGRIVAEATAELVIPTMGDEIRVSLAESLVIPIYSGEDEEGRLGKLNDGTVTNSVLIAPRVVLLGDPGAGKSTTGQAVMSELAHDLIEDTTRAVPFRVVLRHYARALEADPQLGIIRFLHRHIEEDLNVGFPLPVLRYLLHTGRAMVLLDGLDEILEPDLRRQVVDRIERFSGAFGPATILCTSRSVGYRESPLSWRFSEVVVHPFDRQRVEQFAETVISHTSRSIDRSLQDFMHETESISDIRSNPLMLGILCALYCSGRTLPRNRAELYSKCAQMLFSEWDYGRGIIVSSVNEQGAEQAIQEIALHMFDEGIEEIAEYEILHQLETFAERELGSLRRESQAFASDTLKLWRGRKWVLVFAGERDGTEYFRFAHRTFLEFFAAEQRVYESADGLSLWREVSPLVVRRSAVPFYLLALQMLSERTRGAADEFWEEALRATATMTRRERFNTVLSAIESAASSRLQPITRRTIVETAIGLFIELLPLAHYTGAQPAEPFEGRDLLSADSELLRDEELQDELEDTLDLLGQGAVPVAPDLNMGGTLDEVTLLLLRLSDLPDAARAEALELLEARTNSVAADDDGVSLSTLARLAMILEAVPRFRSWRYADSTWCDDLRALAKVYRRALRNIQPDADSLPAPDFWVDSFLLRKQLSADVGLLQRLGWKSIFVTGTPYPIIGDEEPSLAHVLLASYLRFEHLLIDSCWDEDAVEKLAEAHLRMWRESKTPPEGLTFADSYVGHLASPQALRASPDRLPTRSRYLASLVLLAGFVNCDDRVVERTGSLLSAKPDPVERHDTEFAQIVSALVRDGNWDNFDSMLQLRSFLNDEDLVGDLRDYARSGVRI